MTKTYTISLTEAENKALSIIAFDPNEWIQNVVHSRCEHAIEEIVSLEVQRLLSEGKPITGSKDDIVMASVIPTAAERQALIDEEDQKLKEQQEG